MHRTYLRGAILIRLLAVMAGAGGCVAPYTLSKAAQRPGDAGEGVGLPLSLPGTAASTPSATAIGRVTTQDHDGDGLPFAPHVTETLSNSSPAGTNAATGADMSPPQNGIGRGSQPATPL